MTTEENELALEAEKVKAELEANQPKIDRKYRRMQERVAKESDEMFRLLINRYYLAFMNGQDIEKETLAKWNMFCAKNNLIDAAKELMKLEIEKIKEQYQNELKNV